MHMGIRQPEHTLGEEARGGATVATCFAALDGIVLNGQWETTETNAGVFDCDESALQQILLQHWEGPLEDGVDEFISYRAQAKGDEGWILASS